MISAEQNTNPLINVSFILEDSAIGLWHMITDGGLEHVADHVTYAQDCAEQYVINRPCQGDVECGVLDKVEVLLWDAFEVL